jgi:hypothetical protein
VLGPSPPPAGRAGGGVAVAGSASGASGSIGTPGSASPVPTGDAQLDRVNAINIDQVRDQRMGNGAVGTGNDRRTGPAVAANDPNGPNDQAPPAADNGAPNAASNATNPPVGEPPKRVTPVYKKWWFWAVVAVSGYVVYSLATDSSKSGDSTRGRSATPSGLTLLRW